MLYTFEYTKKIFFIFLLQNSGVNAQHLLREALRDRKGFSYSFQSGTKNQRFHKSMKGYRSTEMFKYHLKKMAHI